MTLKLKTHHPRVLLVLLLMIGALASTAILLADQCGEVPTESVAIPTGSTVAPISEQEKEDAVNIVTESGVVKQINGGQSWKPSFFSRAKIGGVEGIRLDSKWNDPVDSSGPWSLLFCSGTRQSFATVHWSQVTRLVVWVDLEREVVAGFGVTSVSEDIHQPQYEPLAPNDPMKIYDAESGEIIYEGPSSDVRAADSKLCEEGTYPVD